MFFLISIQKEKTGSFAQAIFQYANRSDAMSAYHSTLASNYISEALDGFCTMVINEHGGTEIKEYYYAPVITPIEGE